MKKPDRSLGRIAAIVGMGDAYADKDHVKDPLQLAAEASLGAFRDAGIKKDDIDILLTGRAPWADRRPQWSNIFASYLQLPVRMTTEITFHGAGVNAMIGQAALAIAAGVADYVLCVQSDAVELFIDATAVGAATDACPQFEFPYGPTIPTIYAQLACRYMHEFGVTEEDFAEVAVQRQEWAVHHPKAAKRKHGLITVEDVMRSPYISTPLRRWMCATWGPGAPPALSSSPAWSGRRGPKIPSPSTSAVSAPARPTNTCASASICAGAAFPWGPCRRSPRPARRMPPGKLTRWPA